MRIAIETTVEAPPDVVFATATDISRWPDFIAAVERVEMLTEGPVRVGSRFRETRTMYGRQATEEMTVAALEPPHRFVLTAENHGARYEAVHAIAQAAEGSRLTLTFSGEPVTFAARIFSFISVLFAGGVRRALQTDLDQLKAEAERRAGREASP